MTRIGTHIALVALTGLLAGCGTSPLPSPPVKPSAPPPTVAPGDDGTTVPSAVFGPQCARLPANGAPGPADAMATRPVTAALSQNFQLTVFSSLINRAHQSDRLDRLIGGTVFAPTDEAFAKYKAAIGADRYEQLTADPARLADLVDYHVIDHRYDRDGLLATTHGVATLYGGVLKATAAGDTISVTDGTRATATVLCGNIPTANATVFLIDLVLKADPNRIR